MIIDGPRGRPKQNCQRWPSGPQLQQELNLMCVNMFEGTSAVVALVNTIIYLRLGSIAFHLPASHL